MVRRLSAFLFCIVLVGALPLAVGAQQAKTPQVQHAKPPQEQRATQTQQQQERASQKKTMTDRVNRGIVGLVAGGVNGTYIQVAADLATVLDNEEKLRILPMIGKGSVQNITDLLYLKGVDMSIVQSDVLTYLSQQKIYRGLGRRVHYITKLYNEELHLLAGKGTNSVQDLAGKKVNFGVEGSGTNMTATTVFATLDVDVEPTSYDQALALEKLKSGEIAAMIYVTGKPARQFTGVTAKDGLHFVSIPYSMGLSDVYLPAQLTAEDYPGLVAADERVETLAVGAVLAVFNWSADSPRYRSMARFIDAFFSRIDEFQQAPRHKKWTEVSLTARVPGWRRFAAAEQWLKENGETPEEQVRALFMQFLSEMSPSAGGPRLSDEQKEMLFGEFVRWQRQEATGANRPKNQ